ncbi:MAG: ABC transporter permease subunit [Victivallaceae bacterium]|nr:ABC transporter permease subunit [Victivallaceae bacterium]
MRAFNCRKVIAALLVIPGVALLTFLLFNIAGGDPAAAVMGKHAAPAEIENFRRKLGSDLPLFYGRLRQSEVYPSFLPGKGSANARMRFSDGAKITHGEIALNGGKLQVQRAFPLSEPVVCVVRFSGDVKIHGMPLGERNDGKVESFTFQIGAARIAELVFSGMGSIRELRFSRLQDNPFESQLLKLGRELISFHPSFPYVSVLNFGETLLGREDIRTLLLRGVLPSLALMLPVFFGEVLLGILFALLATAFKERWPDRMLVIFSVLGASVSYLVLIIFAQWFLGYYLNWFPVWGFASWRSLLLPVLVGIISGVGANVMFYRTVFVNELHAEYLRTAVAKGCSPLQVYGKHLLRNAAVPMVAQVSSALPFLFTGSLLLERFFGIPGLGYAGIEALSNSDIQLLKALVIVSAILFVGINLAADLLIATLDKRIRLE